VGLEIWELAMATAWYFLTVYWYAIAAGPFATQQQCDEMRAFTNRTLWSNRISACYQAPLVSAPAVVPETCQAKQGCQ
jgi:hypothetical protein